MSIDYRSVVVGALALVVFVLHGFRQLYLAKNVDILEHEGKIGADVAARIRNKPMKLIGWASVAVGVAFFLMSVVGWW